MPSNKDLRAQVVELSATLTLDVPANLEDLSNKDLLDLVAALEQKATEPGAREVSNTPPLDGTLPAQPPKAPEPGAREVSNTPPLDGTTGELEDQVAAVAAPKKYPFQVAPGASICGARGIIGPGEEVFVGKDAPTPGDMNHWIELGAVLGEKIDPAKPAS